MALRVPFARGRIARAAEADGFEPPRDLDALLDDAERLPPPSRTRVLHGDLHARHVLVDGEGRASGVIDWGDVCVGDPSIDLSIAYGSFSGAARRAFLEAYGPVDGLTELRARVIATFLSAALLSYAVDRNLAELREDSRRGLERVVR
jgi:aminoglycoside phosphotransferase (APT) family kinase protein